ncbi:MAG TPA: hypothetical protein VM577_20525 [Anaerovoracaceae bacterium]|nr:hypothetical protein [Anaerovoracaceae bacterium]
MIEHSIKEGLSTVYEKETTTGDAYSSTNADAGTLDYLVSTPSIITMIIDAAADMLDQLLPPDYITVGKKIELIHEQPSLVGEKIILKLEVKKLEGNSVLLNIEAKDSKGQICSGIYERMIINKDKLLNIAYERSPELI